ncbi:hypothetical protein YPPY72_1409, partial [Yersinia pestis PY-72]
MFTHKEMLMTTAG